ncbi:hypothetical protein METHB2_1130005 [Candidatus Methylobacter favarea]|uniref:Uncharacterized protein n=1 Tax=Candidatus Methylobacter favarea TaxID=2707345 RepID=A0A8S0WMA6_9GAMM|nr:hypothetical protein METHB2_1130005 [Candidatus Methylobacter favarea]
MVWKENSINVSEIAGIGIRKRRQPKLKEASEFYSLANDFIISGISKELLENEVKPQI